MYNTESIKEMFPDWKEIHPEHWSKYGKILEYAHNNNDTLQRNKFIEIGLYREPIDGDEKYDGTYTLQIFNVDNVIFCETVEGLDKELKEGGNCNMEKYDDCTRKSSKHWMMKFVQENGNEEMFYFDNEDCIKDFLRTHNVRVEKIYHLEEMDKTKYIPNRDKIIKTDDPRGGFYYEFVSKNGLHYELLHGYSVGSFDVKYSSGTMFIILNIFCDTTKETEIIDKFGCSEQFVGFFQSSYLNFGNKGLKEDEEYIREIVDKYELEHKELVNTIIENNIKTDCHSN